MRKLKDSIIFTFTENIISKLVDNLVWPLLIGLVSAIGIGLTGFIESLAGSNMPWQYVTSTLWPAIWSVLLFISGLLAGWSIWSHRAASAIRHSRQIETTLFESFCVYEKGRIPHHVDVYRDIRSLSKEPLYKVPFIVGYYAQSGPRNIKIEALGHGAIEGPVPTQFKRLRANYILDEPIPPGGIGKINYRVTVTGRKEEPASQQSVHATYSPLKKVKIGVRFAPDALPLHVWRAQWLNGVESPPELLDQLKPVSGNTYEAVFQNVPAGLNIEYGLYWTWH